MAEPSLQPEGGCLHTCYVISSPVRLGMVKAPRGDDVLPKVWREHRGHREAAAWFLRALPPRSSSGLAPLPVFLCPW